MHIGRKRSILATSIGLVTASFSFSIFLLVWPNLVGYLKSSYSHTWLVIDLILGFSMRPLMALFFGPYGDNFGRKRLMVLTTYFLATVSFLFFVMPFSPAFPLFMISFFITLLRAVQGAIFGADLAVSTTYLSEVSTAHRRGKITSLVGITQEIGIALSLLFISFLSAGKSFSAPIEYNWKLPSAISFIFILIALFMRKKIQESPVFHTKSNKKNIIVELFKKKKKDLFIAMILAIFTGISFYLFRVFILFHAIQDDILLISEKQTILFVTTLSTSLCIWLGGVVSDIVGRKPVLFTGALGVALLAWPMFVLMTRIGDESIVFIRMLVGQLVISLFAGFYTGALYPYLAEVFPKNIRNSGISISYNLAMSFSSMFIALFGIDLGKNYTAGALPGIIFGIWSLALLVLITSKVNETFKRGLNDQ